MKVKQAMDSQSACMVTRLQFARKRVINKNSYNLFKYTESSDCQTFGRFRNRYVCCKSFSLVQLFLGYHDFAASKGNSPQSPNFKLLFSDGIGRTVSAELKYVSDYDSDSKLIRPLVKSAYQKIIFLSINQNICCWYSNEPSQ